MSARQPKAFALTADEHKALDAARQKFAQWRRDWHDDGAAFNSGELAELRKAARAFHKALAPLLGPDAINGTRARLLARMQELHGFQRGQADYHDDLQSAMFTAIVVDGACARDVRSGVKANGLAYAWVCHAADAWPGDPTANNRFSRALLEYDHANVPGASAERIEAALTLWRKQRNG